ncbi:hypothetical protein JW898_00625 [Candidatus Woesearchaeota archaeon]|nr:hypothetical protein [Candidatus Woesearchaeota archaeon]
MYVVVQGQETRLGRVGYNVAEVWRMKQFGRAKVREPTEQERSDPYFNVLSLLSNEVISADYTRVDPFAEEKLQATVALYLEAALKAVPSDARVTYHLVDKDICRSESVTEESVAEKQKAAKRFNFVPCGNCRESIPAHLGLYDTDTEAVH